MPSTLLRGSINESGDATITKKSNLYDFEGLVSHILSSFPLAMPISIGSQLNSKVNTRQTLIKYSYPRSEPRSS